jgi:hypothetical protein
MFFDKSEDSNFLNEPTSLISSTSPKRDIVTVLQKSSLHLLISLTRPLIYLFQLEVSKKMNLLKLRLCEN